MGVMSTMNYMFFIAPKIAIGDPYDWWCSHHKHQKERFRIHKIINIMPKIRQKIINSWHCILEEIIEGDELDAVDKC